MKVTETTVLQNQTKLKVEKTEPEGTENNERK